MSEESVIERASQFGRSTVEELKRISTPTRQQTIQTTLVTLGFLVLIAIVVALLDLVFGQLMKAVILP